jgi:hypothetical protein
MKKIFFLFLILIFGLAFFLRIVFLKNLSLTFGYDQARDAYVSQQILKGDLKILGPPASTPGLYHGVIYYYILAPAYLLGHGNPIIAAVWIAFLNSLTIFTVFYLTYLFTKKVPPALLAAIFFGLSFESVQYATWLSNPTLGVITVPLIYLGLWLWIKEKNKFGPAICALGLGLSIQSEIFLLYQAVPIALWLWISRKTIKKSQLVTFIAVLLLSVSTMILAEFKFGFNGLKGAFSLFTTQDAIAGSRSLGDYIFLFLNQLGRVFAFSSYPGNIGYGSVIIFVLIIFTLIGWNRKEISWRPFLASWLFSHITVVSVGGISTPFLLVGIGPAVSILLGIIIYQWFLTNKKFLAIALLTLIILGNMAMILKEDPKGSTIFAIQKDMLLKKQLALIDYTYQDADGKPFSINSVTSPLWINIVWTYLYKWYGQPKYGYLPEWHGKDQIGQLDTLPPTSGKTTSYYLIIEPMEGIPGLYLDQTLDEENSYSKLIAEKNWGELRLQKRIRYEKQE